MIMKRWACETYAGYRQFLLIVIVKFYIRRFKSVHDIFSGHRKRYTSFLVDQLVEVNSDDTTIFLETFHFCKHSYIRWIQNSYIG